MVKQVGKYELGNKLGAGSFATVRAGTHVETKEVYAVKIIDRQRLQEENMEEQLKREIAMMKLLKHENVVQMKEVMVSGKHIYIVMEIVRGGEFITKIKASNGAGLDEDVARRYFQQLVAGLEYCHHQGVAHRDLKPQNMLLDEATDAIKIADFGLANVQDANSSAASLMTACGSPQYVAPEVLSESGYHGHLADVWSCGVILFYMLSGQLPFNDTNQNGLFLKIQRGVFRMPSSFSDEAKDLIKNILVVDPKKRFTLQDIIAHEWFSVGIDSVSDGTLKKSSTLGHIGSVPKISLTEENIRNAVTKGEETA